MDGIMDNNMIKRYPCRNYERLLAAEALPMIGELTSKADLEMFYVLSLSTNKGLFKTLNVSNFNPKKKLAKEILFLECIYT